MEAHCLAGSPQCALLAARAVEQALAREPAPKAATSSAGPAASSACPPSPALDADVPRCAAGTKRKAEAPTALLTPVMKVGGHPPAGPPPLAWLAVRGPTPGCGAGAPALALSACRHGWRRG